MVQADPIGKLMRAALISEEEFVSTLNHLLHHDLRISVRELSEKSGIAQSSLYKILHGKRSPNLTTLRESIKALRQFCHVDEEDFIGGGSGNTRFTPWKMRLSVHPSFPVSSSNSSTSRNHHTP